MLVLASMVCCTDTGRCSLRPMMKMALPFATSNNLFTPTWVLHSITNAAEYFRDTMTESLAGVHRQLWVDGILWWHAKQGDLLCTLGTRSGGIWTMLVFFRTPMTWCGKVLSGEQVNHDRKRLRGLGNMGRS